MRSWLVLFLVLSSSAFASGYEDFCGEANLSVVLFYRDSCPHCADEREFLDELIGRYPCVSVIEYPADSNRELFEEYASIHNCSTQYVPVTFIGDYIVQGFNSPHFLGARIENRIRWTLCELNNRSDCTRNESRVVPLPFGGELDTERTSLPALTAVIGFLDGFNPCALWVLTFLMALMVHAGSRKRMLLVGLLFTASSAFVYFMFMSAWLNAFLYLGLADVTRLLVGVLAVAAGALNLKDFLWFKKGISLSIPESAKPRIYRNMRRLVREEDYLALFLGTVTLAFFVNLVELACTAGFPAIYTRILTLKELPPIIYYGYLALYNVFYALPLALVVFVVTYTMGSAKLSEKQGRVLKLAAGLMMVSLGILMVFAPDALALT